MAGFRFQGCVLKFWLLKVCGVGLIVGTWGWSGFRACVPMSEVWTLNPKP